MATLDELLRPFAKSVHAKVCALDTLKLTSSERARLLESISDDVKKCTNFLPPEISLAAYEEAQRIGVDLSTKNWHDQPAFDGGRETFHFEHVVPVSAIRNLCLKAQAEEEVFNILRTRLRIAWILKREDSELTRLGYRSKRDDPEAAYRHANIEFHTQRGSSRS